jgi:RAT1-interacting protein
MLIDYKEVTYFSYDDQRQYHQDASSLQYYWPPTHLPADLCAGFDSFHKWDDSIDEHLVGLLRAIMDLEQKTNERVKTDVITWRGMMTKFMSTPFDRFGS